MATAIPTASTANVDYRGYFIFNKNPKSDFEIIFEHHQFFVLAAQKNAKLSKC